MSLTDTRVVFIGGGSGIGLETAKLAAAEGAEVVIAGRSAERIEAALAEIGGDAEGYQLDAMDEPAVAAFFAGLGAFDHLCLLLPTTTGPELAARLGPFVETALNDLRESFEVKFWAAMNCVKHGSPNIRANGSITFVTGAANRKALPGFIAGAAANGALEAIMRVLALELAPIRVNTIAPGLILTPILETWPAERRERSRKLTETQPIPRHGEVGEVARGIFILMDNAYVTGATLVSDGGYTLT